MQLSSLLDPEYIKVKVKSESRTELTSLLLGEMFARYHFQIPHQDLTAAIAERETLGGTTFATGIAIPHARIDLFNDILIGIAIPAAPFMDNGVLIRMVVLILTSKTTSNLYLNCLASFVKLSKNTAVFESLGLLSSAQEVISSIQSQNIEVKTELTIEQIMTHEMYSVTPDTPIKQVIDLMAEKSISFVPVIGNDNVFQGEITVLEILNLGIPNYAQMIGNINFLKTFEPMEELLAKEEKILANEIMDVPTNSFTSQTSIVEAVFTFTKTRKRQIPVLDGQKIIGVVSYMDILRKVLRG